MTINFEEMIRLKQTELEASHRRFSRATLEALAGEAPAVTSLYEALMVGWRPHVIGDIAPRQGAKRVNSEALGQDFLQKGAVALIAPTDQISFGASSEDFKSWRTLFGGCFVRREFIVDEYQVVESRALGADTFTLYVDLLDSARVQYYLEAGREYQMEAMLLCKTPEGLKGAAACDALILGVVLGGKEDEVLLNQLKSLRNHDSRLATVVDASLIDQKLLQKFDLSSFHAVILSHKTLHFDKEGVETYI